MLRFSAACCDHPGGAVIRATEVLVAVALVLAFGAAAGVDREVLARTAVKQMATADLRVLARSSGLTDASTQPLPVFVQQDGGPLWVTEAVTRAALRTTWLRPEPASHHRLHAEVIHARGVWALRLSLWRQGWTLRNPTTQRLHLAPWVATASAVGGAIVALAAVRIGLGLAVSGLLAQLFLMVLPGASLPGAKSLGSRVPWVDGPLGQRVVHLARELPDLAVGVGAIVVATCLVLVAVDHRRSKGQGGARLGWGLVGVLGSIAWLEASAQSGLFAYAATTIGVIGLGGILGLWTWVGAHCTGMRKWTGR
jgi:hypothetical protein